MEDKESPESDGCVAAFDAPKKNPDADNGASWIACMRACVHVCMHACRRHRVHAEGKEKIYTTFGPRAHKTTCGEKVVARARG